MGGNLPDMQMRRGGFLVVEMTFQWQDGCESDPIVQWGICAADEAYYISLPD